MTPSVETTLLVTSRYTRSPGDGVSGSDKREHVSFGSLFRDEGWEIAIPLSVWEEIGQPGVISIEVREATA